MLEEADSPRESARESTQKPCSKTTVHRRTRAESRRMQCASSAEGNRALDRPSEIGGRKCQTTRAITTSGARSWPSGGFFERRIATHRLGENQTPSGRQQTP